MSYHIESNPKVKQETKGMRLYHYLAKKHIDKLFTQRHILIASEMCWLSDEEFDRIVNKK